MCSLTLRVNATASDIKNPAYALVFGSVVVLGLPLNAVSLWILIRRHSLKSPSAVFMVNLAISDVLLVTSLPLRVYFYTMGLWPLGHMTCTWITMLFRNNIRSSSIFITFISVDRLLAVVYPLRSRHIRTSANAWRAAVLVWVAVVLINIPESVMFSKTLKKNNETTCFEFKHPVGSPISYLQPVLVLTLLTANIVCTALVSWTLHRRLNDSARIRNKVNVMLIFAMNLLMFTIFFFPASLTVLERKWRCYAVPLFCLASVNCCLDPVLYYFSFDGFWKREEAVDNSGREL
ncbi:lysophosphatidic acid receptor 6-like [Echeneis naucrates]|uniref:Lysophosphatidic acid receptor 6-like n=1 Tax=Echeneis naucrates TaxID=173247 RepID=A0A665VYJ8_ECHNA|nr:lysophosphatidic acid receptor 6-like [Echeneis naucrates]